MPKLADQTLRKLCRFGKLFAKIVFVAFSLRLWYRNLFYRAYECKNIVNDLFNLSVKAKEISTN